MEPTTESLLRDNAELYRRTLVLQLIFATSCIYHLFDKIRDDLAHDEWRCFLGSAKTVLRRAHEISKAGDFDACRIASCQVENVLARTEGLVSSVKGESDKASMDKFFYETDMGWFLKNMQDL